VFRSRSQEEKAPATQVTADLTKHRDPQAPKGRPTPKRSAAQSQRRRAVTPPADRKSAVKRQRESRRADMARQREALANGDERHLPPQHKGAVKRYVRDYVDARYCMAEFFLPSAVVILVLTMVRVGALQSIALLLWLVVIIVIIADSVLLRLRLKKNIEERFPNEDKRGAVWYGLMRTLQVRRLRLPKPQVKRGATP
jgi:Protein of unknown function (DUF3043)